MGDFPVRYNSRVVIYDRRGFIRLATGHTGCEAAPMTVPHKRAPYSTQYFVVRLNHLILNVSV